MVSETLRRALSEHEWGGKTVQAVSGHEGYGYQARTIFRTVPICTRCGVSRSAAEFFGWDCEPGHEGRGDSGGPACRDCGGPLMHVGPDYWTCRNPECPSHSQARGVRATTEPEAETTDD